MDVGEFAQENKQWLVGCAIGAVVWLIGGAIVDSISAPAPLPRRQDTLREAYRRAELEAAQDQNDSELLMAAGIDVAALAAAIVTFSACPDW